MLHSHYPIAIASPEVIGPVALGLANHEQPWTREVACALGLLSGDNYVDGDALLAALSTATDTRLESVYGFSYILRHTPITQDLLIRGAEFLLRDNPPASHVETLKAIYKAGQHSVAVHEQLGAILQRHLKPEEMSILWSGLVDTFKYFDSEEYRNTHREFDRAILEAIYEASKSMAAAWTTSEIDLQKIHSVARICSALDIGEFSMTDVYVIGQRRVQDILIEVVRGAILVTSVDPAKSMKEAEYSLQKIGTSEVHLYTLLEDSRGLRAKTDLDWSRAQDKLESHLLFRALECKSASLCEFAARLLWESVQRNIVREGMKEVLNRASEYGLAVIAQVASELWEEEADDLILDRLERNPTDDCVPLVKVLGDLCKESSKQRAEAVLRRAIESANVDMVEAAVSSVGKLGLDEPLESTIRNRYYWWFSEGPQDPVGGGVVPENAAASLLSHLVATHRVSIEEIREAANARRRDIREVAIKALCQHLAVQEELFEPTIEDVNNGKLPSGILNELSKSHPSLCRDHTRTFLKLLASDEKKVQVACLHALSDGWADTGTVEAHIRQLLSASDPDIRDEATNALRRLITTNSTISQRKIRE